MSDTEKPTPNKTGASGAPWTDAEKIAYLLILCEHEGKVDAKIASAPIPLNRSIISCKKLLLRLKEKHKDDIAAIRAGIALTPVTTSTTEGAATGDAKDKPKTPRKRKSKAAEGTEGEVDGTPSKKAKGKKKKVSEEIVKDEEEGKDEGGEGMGEVKTEEGGEDMMV